jgi:hypothetical protein
MSTTVIVWLAATAIIGALPPQQAQPTAPAERAGATDASTREAGAPTKSLELSTTARPGDLDAAVKERARLRQTPLFGGWDARVDATWTDTHGFRWQSSSTGAELFAPSAKWSTMPADASWRLKVRATRVGPAGLRFTGQAGNRRGYELPTFLSTVVGSDQSLPAAGTQLFHPGSFSMAWDAQLRVERPFEFGRLEVRLIGEALASLDRGGPASPAAGSPATPTGAAKRLPSRAARLGVKLGF